MKQTILLIDDENLVMRYYKQALEKEGFDVQQSYDPDTGFESIEKGIPQLAAVILDIMMLPGKRYQDKVTFEGLRTGIFLLRDIREHFPDLPILVLTNVADRDTLHLIDKEPNLTVVQKIDYPPFELARLARKVIDSSERNRLQERETLHAVRDS